MQRGLGFWVWDKPYLFYEREKEGALKKAGVRGVKASPTPFAGPIFSPQVSVGIRAELGLGFSLQGSVGLVWALVVLLRAGRRCVFGFLRSGGHVWFIVGACRFNSRLRAEFGFVGFCLRLKARTERFCLFGAVGLLAGLEIWGRVSSSIPQCSAGSGLVGKFRV